MGYPNDTDPYMLTTDASLSGIGTIISQKQQWDDRLIAYANKMPSNSQRNYSGNKRKVFAIVFFSQRFRNYLLRQKFRTVTDQEATTGIYILKKLDGL